MDRGSNSEVDVRLVWESEESPYKNELQYLHDRHKVKFKKSNPYILALTDALALVSALVLARLVYWLHFFDSQPPKFFMDFGVAWSQQLILFSILAITTLAWFWRAGHYSRRRPQWDDLRETTKIILLIGMLNAALIFLAKWPVSRVWLSLTWTLSIVFVPMFRVLVKNALLAMGGWRQPTVVIGIGENAKRVTEALHSEHLLGYEVTAFIAGPGHAANKLSCVKIENKEIPVLFYSNKIKGLLENLGYPHLVIALEAGEEDMQRIILRKLGAQYRNIHIAPPATGLPLYGTEIHHFFRHEVLLLNIRNNLGRYWARVAKRCFDLVFASLILVAITPLLLTIAFLVWIQDGESSFYIQERVGRGGKRFKVIKFRSMIKNAHELLEKWKKENPEIWEEYKNNNNKLRNDPRMTSIGKWLRKTSMDELPQLLNVIKGDMSLVGPRPLLAHELREYGEAAYFYLQARPGITGIWQISGRSKTSFQDRANLDSWYIRNWSLWYDVYILLRTIKVVLHRDGAY